MVSNENSKFMQFKDAMMHCIGATIIQDCVF